MLKGFFSRYISSGQSLLLYLRVWRCTGHFLSLAYVVGILFVTPVTHGLPPFQSESEVEIAKS